MKLEEIRECTAAELQDKIVEFKKQLFDLRLKKSTHKLENTAEIGKLKNLIAQMKTVIKEKSNQEVK